MDATDRKILAELQAAGRLTVTELAQRVSLSVAPCLRRLRELERSGTIRGYRAVIDPAAIGLLITQSGETADTLAALSESKRKGHATLALCNVVGSSIAREADGGVYLHAGPEIGVASTKAFTSQLVALYLLALRLGQVNGTLTPPPSHEIVASTGLGTKRKRAGSESGRQVNGTHDAHEPAADAAIQSDILVVLRRFDIPS